MTLKEHLENSRLKLLEEANATTEIMNVLYAEVGQAIALCQKHPDDPFYEKACLRSFFGYVEGSLFRLRLLVVHVHGIGVAKLTPEEIAALEERTHVEVNRKGEFVSSAGKRIPAKGAIRITITAYEKTTGIKMDFSAEEPGYHAFQRAMQIRDELGHPKQLSDITLDKTKLADVSKALDWYHGFLERFNQTFLSSAMIAAIGQTGFWRASAQPPS